MRMIAFAMLFAAALDAAGADDDGWVDLLPRIDVDRNRVAGEWSLSQTGVTTQASPGARLTIPVTPPREYDFRVRFTRRSGRHSIALIFVSGRGQATVEVDAWSQHLAGILPP